MNFKNDDIVIAKVRNKILTIEVGEIFVVKDVFYVHSDNRWGITINTSLGLVNDYADNYELYQKPNESSKLSVVCLKNDNVYKEGTKVLLTIGKNYEVLSSQKVSDTIEKYLVVNDKGEQQWYDTKRFALVVPTKDPQIERFFSKYI